MAELLEFNAYSQRIPLMVITGFLGSGKTTLINHLLRQTALQDTAVIVNEFGEIGVDHLLVQAATEDVVVIDGGCVCCTIRGDLLETLVRLFEQRCTGIIPIFKRVIIETTGLADPAPVIHTLLRDQQLNRYFYLAGVITTVDALYGLEQLDQHYETVKQAAMADRLVLTKVALSNSVSLQQLQQRLQQLNPAAVQLLSDEKIGVKAEELLNIGFYHSEDKSIDVSQWLQAESYAENGIVPLDNLYKKTESTEIRHDRYIRSFCIERTQPLSWKVLNRWFQQLVALRGRDLLRVKGLVYTEETPLPILVQGVQHVFQPPTTLPAWPKQPPVSQIVFITRNIEQHIVDQMLDILTHSRTPQEMCQAALILLGCQRTI
jgi:G3E family GTPase